METKHPLFFALPLIGCGYEIIPLGAPYDISEDGKTKLGKAPRWKDWQRRRLPDSADMLGKCAKNGWNAGVRLADNDLVVDADPRRYPAGRNPLQELAEATGWNVLDYPCVRTGGGGLHVYMKKPRDWPVRGELREYPGIEFKSKGRQVVAPGSTHPDTSEIYRWETDPPDEWGPPGATSGLLDAVRRPDPVLSDEEIILEPDEIDKALEALGRIEEYDDWVKALMAIHAVSGGTALEQAQAWSDPGCEELVATKWASFDVDGNASGKVGFGTLVHLCEENFGDSTALEELTRSDPLEDFGLLPSTIVGGELTVVGEVADGNDGNNDDDNDWAVVPKTSAKATVAPLAPEKEDFSHIPETPTGMDLDKSGNAVDTMHNARVVLHRLGLRPGRNMLTEEVEFLAADEKLPWNVNELGRTLNDDLLVLVRGAMADANRGSLYEPSKTHAVDALTHAALDNSFHPVLEYLDSLPEWDKVERCKDLFPRGFSTVEAEDYAWECGIRFMVSAIARVRKPGAKVDTMPVVNGPQGAKKSSGIRTLFGERFFSDAGLPDVRSKDAAMLIHGVWCLEYAELAGMTRQETGAIKAFLSRQSDRYRPPYGRYVQTVPRQSVVFGTVNESGYLGDATGGRRFWPLNMVDEGNVDIEWIAENRDLLWAEADWRFKNGERWWLEGFAATAAQVASDGATTEDPWVHQIQDLIAEREDYALGFTKLEEGMPEPGPMDRIHATELLDHLNLSARDRNRATGSRVRTLMEHKLGFRYLRGLRIGSKCAPGYVRRGSLSDLNTKRS